MPHLTVHALEPQIAGHERDLIARLTQAVTSVYGEAARDLVAIRLVGLAAGRWAVGGVPCQEAAPAVTFAVRENAFTRADGRQIAARLVAAVTDAVATTLGEHHRDGIVVDLVATRDDRTAVGGRLVSDVAGREADEFRDRVEIEALRAEFTDAVMMNDHDRLASLFVPDGVVRIPDAGIEAVGRDGIRGLGQQREAGFDVFVQTAHPGVVSLSGDTATGRACLSEVIRIRGGGSHLNYALYHDRYRRTPEGWRFVERAYEIRYLDSTPLAGGPGGSLMDHGQPYSAQTSEPRG
ncbi:nuclear transport factor 2 family protein [Streptomyces poriferorum]|uniref:nuclear transport factor 2 family protein n=1 Tax=Streptomyces poriferorum TaxID=2798799 RepID=UPI001F2F4F61|nr:nuclear transport factor 2 family protein [Streptomyces poriferorum]